MNAREKAAMNGTPLSDEAKAYRKSMQAAKARIVPTAAEFRYKTVEIDGKEFFELEGYATTWNQNYVMYDMFGEYDENIRSDALDSSLARDPDVAFLVNHRGVTMARTTNDKLQVFKDLHGLGMRALLNVQRQDVQDLMAAIKDKDVTEMSWAFMLEDGEWNDDFTELTITQADINRGDVSAVNYGANPYTSIWARGQEWAREAEEMPDVIKRSVIERLASTIEGVTFMMESREAVEKHDEREAEGETKASEEKHDKEEPLSRSVSLYRNRLMLLDSE